MEALFLDWNYFIGGELHIDSMEFGWSPGNWDGLHIGSPEFWWTPDKLHMGTLESGGLQINSTWALWSLADSR
jgi:hypothetical protein